MAILPLRNATVVALCVVAVIVIFALIAQPRAGVNYAKYTDPFGFHNVTRPKFSQLRLMAMLLDTQGYNLFGSVADQDLTQDVIRNSGAYVPMCKLLINETNASYLQAMKPKKKQSRRSVRVSPCCRTRHRHPPEIRFQIIWS